MSKTSSFTIWCIKTTSTWLITRPLSQPILFVGEQIAADHHQRKKLDQRKNISTNLSLTICHRISLNLNTGESAVNTARKKDLQKNFCVYFCSMFSKTFLANYKRFLSTVVFFSYSIVKILTKQNKHAKLCNYNFQWTVQKQSPGGVLWERCS